MILPKPTSARFANRFASLATAGFLAFSLTPDGHARATSATPAKAVSPAGQVVSLDVLLNGKSAGRWSLLDHKGALFAPPELFQRLGLSRRLNASGVEAFGQIWFSLAAVPQLEAVHYFKEKLLDLKSNQPGALARANLAPIAPSIPPTPAVSAPATASRAPAATPAPAPPRDAATGETRLVPLEVTINGAKTGNWLLMERNGMLYAPEDAFEEWRLNRRPDARAISERGQTWYSLASVPGFEAQMNIANQSVDLKFLPGAFAATRLSQASETKLPVSPALPAAFVNYDLTQTFSNTRGVDASRDLGALVEVGASGELGVLTSTHVGRNILNDGSVTGDKSSWRRLETSFTRDFPQQDLTLRLGDSTTKGGSFGRSTYFGGLQISRNFGFSPGFISQPIPTIAGQSSAPSTVELYINDSLRQTSKVPTGPFVIDNFPLLTGSGQARVVVRDVLGRETVLVQNFFSSSNMLAEGLSDWSLDAGAVRKNIGIKSADYGKRFGAGVWRYGINNRWTLETHGEIGKDTYSAGVGATVELPGQVLGEFGMSISDDRLAGRGHQWLAGLQHNSLRHGFTFRAEGSNRAFRLLGQDTTSLGYSTQISASYTYSSEQLGYLGVGYARINSFDRGPLSTYSANYSWRFAKGSSVTVSLTRVTGSLSADTVGMSLFVPLDQTVTATASVSRRAGQTDAYATVSRPLGAENGLGWRALGGTRGGGELAEAGAYYQGSKGQVTSDVSVSRNQKTARLGMQGGLVFVDGRFFASRRIQESFAVVEVPGYANVGVGFQSSTFARTDADGTALIPRLIPYRRNSIRLDPGELPINAEIDDIEQNVVPGSRVGIKVKFPVRSGRAALIKIVFDDGDVAPAGAELKLAGDNKEFFVARRGEAFVTGLQALNSLELAWNGSTCRMKIDMPTGKLEDIARIGPVKCSGVKR